MQPWSINLRGSSARPAFVVVATARIALAAPWRCRLTGRFGPLLMHLALRLRWRRPEFRRRLTWRLHTLRRHLALRLRHRRTDFGCRLTGWLHPLHRHFALGLRYRGADFGRRLAGRLHPLHRQFALRLRHRLDFPRWLGPALRLRRHDTGCFALAVAFGPRHVAWRVTLHVAWVLAPEFPRRPRLNFARAGWRRFAALHALFRLAAQTGIALGIARFGTNDFRPLHGRCRLTQRGRFRLGLERPAKCVTA